MGRKGKEVGIINVMKMMIKKIKLKITVLLT